MTLWERIKYSMVKPDDEPGATKETPPDRDLAAIKEEIGRSSDKERAIGLVAAPIAAVVGIAISTASLNYAKSHNESLTVYKELTYVLLGLAVLILVASWLRKRMFQGITLALFGVAVFQLHYTYLGFAAPFVLAGAWYLVRAYRLQQELKRVESDGAVARAWPCPGRRRSSAASGQQALYAPDLAHVRRGPQFPVSAGRNSALRAAAGAASP